MTEEQEKYSSQTEHFGDVLTVAAQEFSETAFERFTSGEISQHEFHELSELLRRWTRDGEKLLSTVFKSGL